MKNPRFEATLRTMQELHNKKNQDYAEDGNPYSNFEFAATYAGVTVDQVFAVMMGIKQARLLVLTGSGKVPNNESIEDSLIDLANYAALRASYNRPPQNQVGGLSTRDLPEGRL